MAFDLSKLYAQSNDYGIYKLLDFCNKKRDILFKVKKFDFEDLSKITSKAKKNYKEKIMDLRSNYFAHIQELDMGKIEKMFEKVKDEDITDLIEIAKKCLVLNMEML